MPSPSNRKWFLYGGVLLVLILTALWLFLPLLTKKPKPEPKTAVVVRGSIRQSISATGIVVPFREIEIKSKASGRIVKLPYDVSDPIKKGELLVELDPIDELPAYRQNLAALQAAREKLAQSIINLRVAQRGITTDTRRAKADYLTAQAKQHYADINQKRLNQLLSNQYISQDEYDTASTSAVSSGTDLKNAGTRFQEVSTEASALAARQEDVQIAQAGVAQAQASLLDAATKLKDTKLYAPITGVVSALNVQVGQILASGITTVGGGTPALSVADISRLFVVATVDESDIAGVRVGQLVTITADSFPGKHFSGKVGRIATEGVNTSNVVTFQVKIEVISDNKILLKPQMTTNVEIVEAQHNDTLLVPKDAVRQLTTKHPVVDIWDAARHAANRQPIHAGLSDTDHVEVLSDLHAGDQVVLHQRQLNSKWRKDSNNQRGGNPTKMMMGGGGHRHG